MKCKDCGQEVPEHHDEVADAFEEHIGRCCYCADRAAGWFSDGD